MQQEVNDKIKKSKLRLQIKCRQCAMAFMVYGTQQTCYKQNEVLAIAKGSTFKKNMDWAEELKMSIRKTTARKGRRSKSREQASASTATASSTNAGGGDKEIEIDITLDMQQSSNTTSSIGATPLSSASALESDLSKRPPMRRISGGWADSSILKSSRIKKGSFDDERFQSFSLKSPTHSPTKDEIPVLPDVEDVRDEILLNEIVEPPSVNNNRVVTLKELNSDLLSQNAFSAIEDVDLSILTRCLKAQETLDEADEVWEWNKLFTDVIAEIHSEQQNIASGISAKKEIGPDELPPTMHV